MEVKLKNPKERKALLSSGVVVRLGLKFVEEDNGSFFFNVFKKEDNRELSSFFQEDSVFKVIEKNIKPNNIPSNSELESEQTQIVDLKDIYDDEKVNKDIADMMRYNLRMELSHNIVRINGMLEMEYREGLSCDHVEMWKAIWGNDIRGKVLSIKTINENLKKDSIPKAERLNMESKKKTLEEAVEKHEKNILDVYYNATPELRKTWEEGLSELKQTIKRLEEKYKNKEEEAELEKAKEEAKEEAKEQNSKSIHEEQSQKSPTKICIEAILRVLTSLCNILCSPCKFIYKCSCETKNGNDKLK